MVFMNTPQVKGRPLGKYEIEPCFTENTNQLYVTGRNSRIYRARLRSEVAANHSGRQFAIKVFHPPAYGAAPYLELFRTEGLILSRLDHPNIIQFFESGTGMLDGQLVEYHVMELAGESLDHFVNRRKNQLRPLSLEEALEIGAQIARAIDHAHENGVILRDLKPGNCVLASDGKTIKLLDFDASWIQGTPGGERRVGSRLFAAPEHFPDPSLHSPAYAAPASDIFAFGRLLFFLIANDYLRGCAAQSIVHLPDSLSAEPWADAVCEVLHRATRHDPTERHQSAAALMEALGVATAVQAESEVKIKSRESEFAPPQRVSTASRRQRRRRRRRLVAATVLLATVSMIATCGVVIVKRPFFKATAAPPKKDCGPKNGVKGLRIRSVTTASVKTRALPKSRTVCVMAEGSTAKLLGEVTNNWAQVEVLSPSRGPSSACTTGERGYVYVEHFKIDCE
jgi:serine/threonine protein kinase